jgi:hypothetical protein
MAFCKFCGKELGEDNKCTCAEFQDNERNAEVFVKSVEPTEDTPIKRGGTLKYIIAILAVVLIIALVIVIICASNSYKTPIKDLTKGIRKGNSQLLIESMYTESTAAELRLKAKDNGLTWEEYLKTNDKAIESTIDGLGIKRLKSEVLAKEKLSGSNFDNIEKYYKDTYSADAKKAYRVEVEFTYKENGEKKTVTGWLCVVKLKGDGWKYCPQYSPDNFNFIDTAIKFE